MSNETPIRKSTGRVEFPDEVNTALKDVTELPDDVEEQAEFFDNVQEALSTRLRDES